MYVIIHTANIIGMVYKMKQMQVHTKTAEKPKVEN